MWIKKAYKFLRKDSWLSLIISLFLAFLFVKFMFYPIIEYSFGTPFPIVAVVSSSMEHNDFFDGWWDKNYEEYSFSKEEFQSFDFSSGFNKGDIMIIFKKDVNIGDVLVYQKPAQITYLPNYPIIHRVIAVGSEGYITKGDNNENPDTYPVSESAVLGIAIARVPLLGWIKIGFTYLIGFLV